jgi:hypothetical protein
MAKQRITEALRRRVYERAHGCCEYCLSQAAFAMQAFSLEHVIPESRGGATAVENLALSCQGCNNHKYNKTDGPDPVDDSIVPLFNPRTDRWRDHFLWSADASLIIGLTPIGRATVASLRLNREGLVNLRRILFAQGLHPPALPLG